VTPRNRYATRKRTVKEVLQAVLDEPIVLDDEFWSNQISEGAVDLLKGLLDRDPSRRLTAFEALEHPWVKHAGTASQVRSLTLEVLT
jgi:serine/threonine protein kinase